jgi:NAD(P)H dehydrogenase (quinone)
MVTGASGNLGRHVLDALITAGAKSVIAGTRSPDKLANYQARGITTRKLDFDQPETLPGAFAGVDRLLIISTNQEAGPGERAKQQGAAVAAAVAAGVKHIVYTSITRPQPGALLSIAPDDYATELALAHSPLTWTVLRNNCYMEFLALSLPNVIADRAFYAADGGRGMGYVLRSDCAIAAATALTSNVYENAMYDITGPAVVTLKEVAALIEEVSGIPIVVIQIAPSEMAGRLRAARLPPNLADFLVELHAATARGHFAVATGDFEFLTGRKPTAVRDFLAAAAATYAPKP